MSFFRTFVAGTLILLTFCSVMVIRQFTVNDATHVEMRESFLLLVKKGYQDEANQLYQRLLLNLEELSDRTLINDLQRTAMIVDTSKTNTDNLAWRFYWTVSKELDKRAEIRLGKLLENAEAN
jgi:hypothetical protein